MPRWFIILFATLCTELTLGTLLGSVMPTSGVRWTLDPKTSIVFIVGILIYVFYAVTFAPPAAKSNGAKKDDAK
jgi:hypothetical protein